MERLTDLQKMILAIAGLLAVQALALFWLGQPWVSKTHSLMLWAADVKSIENSQQLTDWYTFSHIIHGLLFYLGLWLVFPKLPTWQRFILAVGLESGWEIFENTPIVINHYREQALAQGYFGDSVINSLSDTCAMILGFIAAWRLPVQASIALAVFLEAFTLRWIHDSLLLNILGFFWTPDFIADWQNEG